MTTFKTVKVDGLDVFCREAGDADAPKLLLLDDMHRRVGVSV
jgi:hypothetical protein